MEVASVIVSGVFLTVTGVVNVFVAMLSVFLGVGSLSTKNKTYTKTYDNKTYYTTARFSYSLRFVTLGSFPFLARDVIYASMSVSVCHLSVCLSVTEVHWRIIANLGFKFRSYFTAHCGRRAARRAACGRIISRHASQC